MKRRQRRLHLLLWALLAPLLAAVLAVSAIVKPPPSGTTHDLESR